MLNRFLLTILIAVGTFACAPSTDASRWADQIDQAARGLDRGQTTTVVLEPALESARLLMIVPPAAADFTKVPEEYGEVFRQANLGVRSETRLVSARQDSLTSSTLAVQSTRQHQLRRGPGERVSVTLRNSDGIVEVVSLQ